MVREVLAACLVCLSVAGCMGRDLPSPKQMISTPTAKNGAQKFFTGHMVRKLKRFQSYPGIFRRYGEESTTPSHVEYLTPSEQATFYGGIDSVFSSPKEQAKETMTSGYASSTHQPQTETPLADWAMGEELFSRQSSSSSSPVLKPQQTSSRPAPPEPPVAVVSYTKTEQLQEKPPIEDDESLETHGVGALPPSALAPLDDDIQPTAPAFQISSVVELDIDISQQALSTYSPSTAPAAAPSIKETDAFSASPASIEAPQYPPVQEESLDVAPPTSQPSVEPEPLIEEIHQPAEQPPTPSAEALEPSVSPPTIMTTPVEPISTPIPDTQILSSRAKKAHRQIKRPKTDTPHVSQPSDISESKEISTDNNRTHRFSDKIKIVSWTIAGICLALVIVGNFIGAYYSYIKPRHSQHLVPLL